MKQCAKGHKLNHTQMRQSTRPHLTLKQRRNIRHMASIAGQHCHSEGVLAHSLGSALHDENPILRIHTAFNILSQNWFRKKYPANEKHLTSKGSSQKY